MSIYKPVSNISRKALGLGGTLLGSVANALGNQIGKSLIPQSRNPSNMPFLNKLGAAVAQKSLNLATSEITRRAANPMMKIAQSADNHLKNIARKGLKTFGLNAFDNENVAHNALHHMGNLSIWQAWQNYKLMNVDGLSRKNFFVLEINDRTSGAPTSNGNRHSQFNLLCTSLSFTSFDIQSEAVQMGSVELDKPSANAKTTLNLTVLDDEFGTIKRWAERKAQMIAASDGTFMPPAYYVFEVRIVFGSNIADSAFYEQIYLMRVQTLPHELSRTEQGLEELQLTFTQTDTFMPTWI